MDPDSGRVMAYTSTDVESFPATRSYPAASLVKLVTAAAALHYSPESARGPCRYRGNPYRLTRSRVYPPKYGNEISLERALATSNNQCFAQLAVNAVGGEALVGAMVSFGFTEPVAAGHERGVATAGDDDYDLGRLGCGLAGCRITPLHAVQLAATLAHGERVQPWWVDGVRDRDGREISIERNLDRRRVMTPELAAELRQMLVRTTTRGTARSAFRDRRGRPKLRGIDVAGKTGNLSGSEPRGRYEWFIGVAPADDPTVAIAVLQVQGHLWWSKSSQIAADVLQEIFCERGRCTPQLASRFTGALGDRAAPVFLSEGGHPLESD
jgi:cell division protein FtsI/penicillin-binding protein 2